MQTKTEEKKNRIVFNILSNFHGINNAAVSHVPVSM